MTTTVEEVNSEDHMKLFQKKKRVKIQRPKLLDELFHQTKQKRSVYYFTSGRKTICKNIEELGLDENPFDVALEKLIPRKSDEKIDYFGKIRKLERNSRVHNKHTFRSRLGRDFTERLFVPDVDERDRPKGIVDMDKQFFTIVKGRPLKSVLDLKKYIRYIREAMIAKLKIGIIYDEVYLIDRQRDIEEMTLNKIRQKLQEYQTSFDEFLAKDNDISMALLREAGEELSEKNKKKEELELALQEWIKVKCDMYNLEEKWAKGHRCKEFLYEISPINWRRKQEKNMKEKQILRVDEKSNVPLSISLESLLEPFFKEHEKREKKKLYFTEPWQLSYVFRDMELQNQNALLHAEGYKKPNEEIVDSLKITTIYFDNQMENIEEKLRELEIAISAEEERAEELKKKANRVIKSSLKEAVSGEKWILLHVHIQNVYEVCIAPDGSQLTAMDMLREIEEEYKQLLLELDALPIDCVKEAQLTVMQQKEYVFGQARDARRKINYLDILMKNMLRALDPPVTKRTKTLMFRSEPPPTVFKPPPPEKEMTLEELEHIHFFTDKKELGNAEEVKLYLPLGY